MEATGFLRSRRTRSTSLVAILLLTVALASFLAYEAWDAARSHRATAERAIRDYADFAAWEFAASTKEEMWSTLVWLFGPVQRMDGRPAPGELPPPSILTSHKTTKLQCAQPASRYHFRLDMRDGSLLTTGTGPSEPMRDWLLDTIPPHARKLYDREWGYAAVIGEVGGERRTVVYRLVRDDHDAPVAAYGFELCLSEFARPLIAMVMKHAAVLPPSLTGKVPNDSLFSVRVSDAHGHELFKSAKQYPSTFSGESRLEYFGGLETRIALRPDLADRLVIGGLPRSRLPVVLGVLALTVVLAAMGLVQLRREAELARLRSDFIASVSHELRTPLAQVRMFAETLLLGRVRSDEERIRSLQIVDQEARRLGHLVENILQFSRAERRAIRLVSVPVGVARHVRETIEAFSPVARARRVTVRAELDEEARVVADAGALRQIILNLLDNAVKYGPAGQTVTVGARQFQDSAGVDVVRFWVADQGPGVAPRDRERIWAPFHRLERDLQSAVAGSGIGLSVVRELVALQRGRVWVEDADGTEGASPPADGEPGAARGARFVVELPAAPRASAAEVESAAVVEVAESDLTASASASSAPDATGWGPPPDVSMASGAAPSDIEGTRR
jgi:signal transduction histidine kinase